MDLGKFWDKYGLYVALLFMMLMMVSYSIAWLRVGVGQGIDSLFAPLVESFKIPFFILIVILSQPPACTPRLSRSTRSITSG